MDSFLKSTGEEQRPGTQESWLVTDLLINSYSSLKTPPFNAPLIFPTPKNLPPPVMGLSLPRLGVLLALTLSWLTAALGLALCNPFPVLLLPLSQQKLGHSELPRLARCAASPQALGCFPTTPAKPAGTVSWSLGTAWPQSS
jgi:hypothetical protein